MGCRFECALNFNDVSGDLWRMGVARYAGQDEVAVQLVRCGQNVVWKAMCRRCWRMTNKRNQVERLGRASGGTLCRMPW
jgi:hypothetical protein